MSATQKEKYVEIVRFRAGADLTRRIDKLAKKKFAKRSELIRQALVEFIESEETAA